MLPRRSKSNLTSTPPGLQKHLKNSTRLPNFPFPRAEHHKNPSVSRQSLQRQTAAQMAQQPSISPSSPTDTPHPMQFPQFASFPTELRRKIWLHTLLPRTIMLYWRMRNSAVIAYQENPTIELDFREPSTSHLTFNARILEADQRPQFFTKHKDPILDHEEWETAHPKKIPSPPGPVALRVCHESRAVCLSRYERAFGSVSWFEMVGVPAEECVITRDEEPRLWVDFEVDEIVLDSPSRRSLPIYLLERYVNDEVKKIRNLGMGRCWDEKPFGALLPILGWGLTSSFNSSLPSLKGSLGIFEGLRELTIYDVTFDTYGSSPREPDVIEAWKENAEKQMQEELEKAKRDRPGWTAELPQLKVVCDF